MFAESAGYFEIEEKRTGDWSAWFKMYGLVVILLVISIVCIGAGVFVYARGLRSNEGITFVPVSEKLTQVVPGALLVDVAGSVERPGVYSLPLDSRVEDALTAAGGLSAGADMEWVSSHLNRAEKILDGGKIFIPRVKDREVGIVDQLEVGEQNLLVSLNYSDQKSLEGLPGVGEVTAQRIIDGRPYGTKDEILVDKIVNSGVWEQVKDLISL